MSENKMTDIIKSSLDGIKDFATTEAIFGTAMTTPSGVTVIPVSKITVGFAGGGVDIPSKKLFPSGNFGGGSGTGITISPVAFLAVSPTSDISVIPLTSKESNSVSKTLEFIESAPEIIEKIKGAITK